MGSFYFMIQTYPNFPLNFAVSRQFRVANRQFATGPPAFWQGRTLHAEVLPARENFDRYYAQHSMQHCCCGLNLLRPPKRRAQRFLVEIIFQRPKQQTLTSMPVHRDSRRALHASFYIVLCLPRDVRPPHFVISCVLTKPHPES